MPTEPPKMNFSKLVTYVFGYLDKNYCDYLGLNLSVE